MAPTSTPFLQRILDHYGETPRGERRLADLLPENSTAAVDHSATEFAERAKVSKATAARFFRRLGYSSFKTAMLAARSQLVVPGLKYDRHIAHQPQHAVNLAQHLQSEVHEPRS